MPSIHTQVIVLAKRPLWEADRIYFLYTEKYGKLEAQVRSAAKSSSKLAGGLEPISLVETMIIRGKSRDTIAGVQLIKRFNFADWQIQAQVDRVRELFLKLVGPEIGEQYLYRNLLSYLNYQEKEAPLVLKKYVTQRFVWQTLIALGHGPYESGNLPDNLQFLPEVRVLLDGCLAKTPAALQLSVNLVQKLESFTARFLREYLEQDFNSFNIA